MSRLGSFTPAPLKTVREPCLSSNGFGLFGFSLCCCSRLITHTIWKRTTKDKSLLNVPHQLSNGSYIEVLFSTDATVSFIKKLLKVCGYKETDIKISVKD